MATLHIEHPISDLQTWLGAFNRFEEAREKAGVRSHRVHQPVDDDQYICSPRQTCGSETAAPRGQRRPIRVGQEARP